MNNELIERIDALIIETALSFVMHNAFIADSPSSNLERSLQTLRDCKAALSQPSVCTGTGLVYAIPDTHRVISVDLLEKVLFRSCYLPVQLEDAVRAIIGSKELHNE